MIYDENDWVIVKWKIYNPYINGGRITVKQWMETRCYLLKLYNMYWWINVQNAMTH